MRWWGLAVVVCACAGCGHPHPAPDAALTSALQAGMGTTLAAMGQPALDPGVASSEATQLAWSTDPARIASIRAGSYSTASLHAEAQAVQRRLRQLGPEGRPPEVLVYLSAHSETIDLDQRLLLSALIAQCVLELPPPSSTGGVGE